MHFISLHKSLGNHRTNYHSPPIAEISIRCQNSSKHRLIQNQISATLSQIPNNICCPSLMCITTICSHICAIYICPVTKAINNYKFSFLRIFQYSGNLCLCQSSFNIDYSYCFGRCHIVIILWICYCLCKCIIYCCTDSSRFTNADRFRIANSSNRKPNILFTSLFYYKINISTIIFVIFRHKNFIGIGRHFNYQRSLSIIPAISHCQHSFWYLTDIIHTGSVEINIIPQISD